MSVRASEVKSKVIDVVHGAADTTTIVDAVSDYRLKIIGLGLQTDTNVDLTVEESDGANRFFVPSTGIAYSIGLTTSEVGWFTTRVGQGVKLRTSGAARVGGIIVYQEIP